MHQSLIELLRCPLSGEPLSTSEWGLQNSAGETYPSVDGIPWLLPHPRNSLLDWGAKLNHFQQVLLSEVGQLENEVKQAHEIVRPRLQALLAGKKQFVLEVTQLLQPLTKAKVADKQLYDALRDRAPSTQNLLSYESNLYRDWMWGDEENQLSLEIVKQHFPNAVDNLVVLGAGACRLAYDVHCAVKPKQTIATDINPLLMLAAKRVISGNDFTLTEFPLHPKNTDSVAVSHDIIGVNAPQDNFNLVFADAAKPAFKPAAFDVVLTPWLIDIQPYELSRFLTQLNHYLPLGGQWVNFGSLVFNQNRDAYCYSIEEISAIAKQSGFTLGEIKQNSIPYLKSPYNAGHRMETVWSWRAEKIADVPALKDTQVLPGWILDPNKPIPKQSNFDSVINQHRTWATLVAEVDGRTSLTQLGKKWAKKNNADTDETIEILRQFFLDLEKRLH